jgi:hypothetical protein
MALRWVCFGVRAWPLLVLHQYFYMAKKFNRFVLSAKSLSKHRYGEVHIPIAGWRWAGPCRQRSWARGCRCRTERQEPPARGTPVCEARTPAHRPHSAFYAHVHTLTTEYCFVIYLGRSRTRYRLASARAIWKKYPKNSCPIKLL